MNRLIIFLSSLATLFIMSACSDDEGGYSYQIANVNAEAREGAIMLRWDFPTDSNFLFVKIEYYNIREQKDVTVNKSIYTNKVCHIIN